MQNKREDEGKKRQKSAPKSAGRRKRTPGQIERMLARAAERHAHRRAVRMAYFARRRARGLPTSNQKRAARRAAAYAKRGDAPLAVAP